ncbi:MAG: long-chain fatty acid--CoA ligase [Candidatus Obscuribacterales bacterium]|nr:long-chain fatty acid--CoA ligase [Candidatus Obscuribacterales bacterium]
MNSASEEMNSASASAEINAASAGMSDIFALLLEPVKLCPNKDAIITDKVRLTYADLFQRTAAIAEKLLECGVKKGDRVGLLFPNHPDYVASFFAVIGLGAVLVPINPLLKSEEIAHILSDSGAHTLIVHLDSLAEALKSQKTTKTISAILVNELPEKNAFIVGDSGNNKNTDNVAITNNFKFISFALPQKSDPAKITWDKAINPEDLALIVYTSGTTGKPKGAMLSHKNLLSVFPGRLDMFDFSQSDITLAVLPMCHIYGITILMFGTISRGGTLAILAKFDAKTALSIIEKERVTIVPAVPAMHQFMLMESRTKSYDLSSVRLCFCGGASLPPALIKELEQLFGAVLIEGYALTETSCTATINPLHGMRKPGSVGPALPGVDIRIIDDNGNELPPGPNHVGELHIKGKNVMLGYYHQATETEESFENGFFMTGDLGYKDTDGYLYIVGRKKELIIRGGQNIYPREIEEVIARMPEVAESAVIGVPDELMGERVKAIIVIKPNSKLDMESVRSFCAQYLAEYKVPRLVEFRTELPRNSTGKVLKRLLS